MSRSLSDQIELLFTARRYKWKFEEEYRIPTAEEIRSVLRNAKTALDSSEGDEVQLERGRLIVRKSDGHYSVYAYFGELDES